MFLHFWHFFHLKKLLISKLLDHLSKLLDLDQSRINFLFILSASELHVNSVQIIKVHDFATSPKVQRRISCIIARVNPPWIS